MNTGFRYACTIALIRNAYAFAYYYLFTNILDYSLLYSRCCTEAIFMIAAVTQKPYLARHI